MVLTCQDRLDAGAGINANGHCKCSGNGHSLGPPCGQRMCRCSRNGLRCAASLCTARMNRMSNMGSSCLVENATFTLVLSIA